MRRALGGPVLTTGVALVAATVVVANPPRASVQGHADLDHPAVDEPPIYSVRPTNPCSAH